MLEKRIVDFLSKQSGEVSMIDILEGIGLSRRDHSICTTVGIILRKTKWMRRRKRINGALVWVYQNPDHNFNWNDYDESTDETECESCVDDDIGDEPKREVSMKNMSPFLTADEAAEWLRVSLNCLSEHRRRGTGPRFYQPGGPHTKVLYRLSDLEDWVENGGAEVELQQNTDEVNP